MERVGHLHVARGTELLQKSAQGKKLEADALGFVQEAPERLDEKPLARRGHQGLARPGEDRAKRRCNRRRGGMLRILRQLPVDVGET